jgi:lipopolysaccharide/colanic/teichoic acid biosynthesis glycosyltransferase
MAGPERPPMTPSKRLFDLILLALLFPILGTVLVLFLGVMFLRGERAFFYISERMKSPTEPFMLIKLRTMTPDAADSGVTGADKGDRITPMGRLLRRGRLDELPQMWNILKGDISFVGPRPPLRTYVERFPDIYNQVLISRPGVTGMASLFYHRHEERLLARCKTAAETDATYGRICVPAKARLDLIYQKHASVCLDIWVIVKTLARLISR